MPAESGGVEYTALVAPPITCSDVCDIFSVVNNSNGSQFTFVDQNNGNYVTDSFIPILDESYSLQIEYNDNTYTATEKLYSVSDITNITQTTEGGFNDDDTEVSIYFDDPASSDNFYLGEFIPSNKVILTLEALSDQFTNGNQNFMEYEDEDFSVGEIVNINLFGISERYFNYIDLLIEQSGGRSGPFQSTPEHLKGNCININDPDEEVLGYFRLSEVVKVKVTIQ